MFHTEVTGGVLDYIELRRVTNFWSSLFTYMSRTVLARIWRYNTRVKNSIYCDTVSKVIY